MTKKKPRRKNSTKPMRRKPQMLNVTDPNVAGLVKAIRGAETAEDAIADITARLAWAFDIGSADAYVACEANTNKYLDAIQSQASEWFQKGDMTGEMYTWIADQFLPMLRTGLTGFMQYTPKTSAVAEAIERVQAEMEAEAENAVNDANAGSDTEKQTGSTTSAGNAAEYASGEEAGNTADGR